jgi:hypothetical protein
MTFPPPPHTGADDLGPDWDHRWTDPSAPLDEPTAPPTGRRRRITHLVLVDGLPADHWVEESADGKWETRQGRRGHLRPVGAKERVHDRERRWLEQIVGGPAALQALDTTPLDVAPLDLRDVPAHLHDRVRAISAECDRHAIEVFREPEMVAVLRHVLEAVLAADAGTLERSSRDDTLVGAVVWIGGHANGLIGPAGALLARDLWGALDLPSSSGSRGASILERLTGGHEPLGPDPRPLWGTPRLKATGLATVLLSTTREGLVARRDHALEEARADGR